MPFVYKISDGWEMTSIYKEYNDNIRYQDFIKSSSSVLDKKESDEWIALNKRYRLSE
jgi:hypothetical protein